MATSTARPAYVPDVPPQDIAEGSEADRVLRYTRREFDKIARAAGNTTFFQFLPLGVAPTKPRSGMVVYADGVNWNPGAGEGLYSYSVADLWVPIDNPTSLATAGFSDVTNGLWTPTDQSGAGLSLTATTANSCSYSKVGKLVLFTIDLSYPATASGLAAVVGGLPATINATGTNAQSGLLTINGGAGGADRLSLLNGTTNLNFVAGTAAVSSTNAQLSGARIRGSGAYFV